VVVLGNLFICGEKVGYILISAKSSFPLAMAHGIHQACSAYHTPFVFGVFSILEIVQYIQKCRGFRVIFDLLDFCQDDTLLEHGIVGIESTGIISLCRQAVP
jgi:hypothetical protein